MGKAGVGAPKIGCDVNLSNIYLHAKFQVANHLQAEDLIPSE